MKASSTSYVFAAGLLTVAGQVARGRGIQARPIIATGVLGVIFIGLETANAPAARTLAAALMITAALTSGVDVARGITNLTGGTTT